MGLWGATDADESQPKYLTDAEKLKVSGQILVGNQMQRDCMILL